MVFVLDMYPNGMYVRIGMNSFSLSIRMIWNAAFEIMDIPFI